MLRALLIAEAHEDLTKLLEQCSSISTLQVMARVTPGASAVDAMQTYKPDIILTSAYLADRFNKEISPVTPQPRSSIKASTHQGIQLVKITDVYFFQADDKYVTAYHTQGQLLIEDSIASLEREFEHKFVRIHRKTLVALDKIERLFKNETGQHFVTVRDKDIVLEVSRRQLPKVRKILLCK